MVLDEFGRPMKRPAAKDLTEELMAPSLGSIRTTQSGHPADGLTPARLGGILRAAEMGDADAYLEMVEQMEEKDLHYAGVLGTRKRAIRKMEVSVVAAGDTDAEQMAAELVRDVLQRGDVKDDFIDMLDGLGKGYSCTEVLWDTSGKYWTPALLKHRDPKWFRFDPVDGQTPLRRDNAGDLPLEYGKFIFHRPKIKTGLPIRGGLGRLAAWGYLFKNFSIRDWAIYLEGYGHPLRIGRYGPSASDTDKATLLRALRMIGTDLAGIIPKSMEIEIIEAGGTTTPELYERKIRFWDEQMSKGVLGQVSTTDAISGGHAVGKIHNEVREDIRDADAEQLAATLQRDLAGPVTFFNFGADVAAPTITISSPDEFDPRMQLLAADKLSARGVPVAVAQLREITGLRAPEEGEEILQAPAQTKPIGSDDTKHTASGGVGHTHGADNLNLSAERVAQGHRMAEVQSNYFEGLLEALEMAQSYEEMKDLLQEAEDALPPDELRQLMAEALLMPRLAGLTGATLD